LGGKNDLGEILPEVGSLSVIYVIQVNAVINGIFILASTLLSWCGLGKIWVWNLVLGENTFFHVTVDTSLSGHL
jgi:hypothetical protein